jgi:hypothetical protein
MTALESISPATIALATVFALLALGIEYFTRAFSTGLRSMGRRLVGPRSSVAIPVIASAAGEVREAEALPAPGPPDPPPRPPQPVSPPPARDSAPTGRQRSAAAILSLVRDLEALDQAFWNARAPAEVSIPYSALERKVREYSIDDLMEIADEELGVSIAGFYREIAEILYQDRRRTTQARDEFDGGDAIPDGNRVGLRHAIAEQIARGTRLARRLRDDSAFMSPA